MTKFEELVDIINHKRSSENKMRLTDPLLMFYTEKQSTSLMKDLEVRHGIRVIE